MLETVLSIAEKLRTAGFSKADRIAVCSENRIEYHLLTLACWKIGAVIVPVSTRYPAEKLRLALAAIDCRDLFVSRSLERQVPDCRRHALEDYVSCRQNETGSMTLEPFEFDLAAECSIVFTSGSSGVPKGVLHTLGNHYYNALGALKTIPFEQGDRWLMSLPMYHISGFSLIMRSLIAGGSIVFPADDESIYEALISKPVSHLSLVPAQLNQWMQSPPVVDALCQCKSILLGGASSNPALIKQALDKGLALSTTYGLTEMGSQVATISPQTLKQKPRASGQILPYRELMIADDGEILVKGPALFKGYVDKDRLELPLDRLGYFHTGDMGDLDEDGCLKVIGRKDRMFLSGGENIYPEEIEKAMLDIDWIEQVYVVPVPDATMGDRPVAFIKTVNPPQPLNAEAIRGKLLSRLEGFNIPVAYLPWPDPDSGSIKPDGPRFRQIAAETMLNQH